MCVREIFKEVDDGVIINGTINGHPGCMHRYRNDTFIVCTNHYAGVNGDIGINKSTGYSGYVSVGESFDGFIPVKKQKQQTDIVKVIIIEFDTFVSVNQNF